MKHCIKNSQAPILARKREESTSLTPSLLYQENGQGNRRKRELSFPLVQYTPYIFCDSIYNLSFDVRGYTLSRVTIYEVKSESACEFFS